MKIAFSVQFKQPFCIYIWLDQFRNVPLLLFFDRVSNLMVV